MKTSILITILSLSSRVLYGYAVYFYLGDTDKKKKNKYMFAAYFIPIITSIVCLVKEKNLKTNIKSIICLVLSVMLFAASAGVNYYNQKNEFKQKENDTFIGNDFKDEEGNVYSFDFDKTGFDYLYINKTSKSLPADLCYLNEEGYLIYDEDMSILSDNPDHCTDTDGKKYYPVSLCKFDDDGNRYYHHNTSLNNFDRLSKPYHYDYVPYYDKDNNKYVYSFSSENQQGYYTNLKTKQKYDNELCFVDAEGYFVYDKALSFKKINNEYLYEDENGNSYYWASSVSWDEDGNMLNCNDEIIDFN